eukprot:653776-Rhodomonas_salina.1
MGGGPWICEPLPVIRDCNERAIVILVCTVDSARLGHGGSYAGWQWHWHHVPPPRLSLAERAKFCQAGARRRHGHGDADIGIS